MLNKLRKLLQTELPTERLTLAEHVRRGASLRLPSGTIVAEQGLRHLPGSDGCRTVQASMDEAYVVVRTDPRSQWYATWQPYSGDWSLLRMEDELDTQTADLSVPAPRLRRSLN
ncbi:MAG TPA: hypothetical protein VNX47_11425 [Nevskia sp.]|nr:hypothetical protein [Nevskia sp.]